MADNVVANAGSGGATFATDEDTANSRHVPLVKLMHGGDGSFTFVSTSSGLPVQQQGSWPVTFSGAPTVSLADGTKVDLTGTPVVALANGTKVDFTGVPTVALQNGTAVDFTGEPTAVVVGNIAHDEADAGAPLKVGAIAETTEQSGVADGDRVNLMADRFGKLVVSPNSVQERWTGGVLDTSATATAVAISAPGAGLHLNITDVLVTNSDASLGSVVEFLDGTAGSVIIHGFASSDGGGFAKSFRTPRRLSANKSLLFHMGTSAAHCYVTVSGFISPT